MSLDSQIAKNCSQEANKIGYNIIYGIATYLDEKLIYDVHNAPICFKFNETTN